MRENDDKLSIFRVSNLGTYRKCIKCGCSLKTACGSHKGNRQKPATCGFPSAALALPAPSADDAHTPSRHSQMLSNWWIISNRHENEKNMLKTNNQWRTLVRKLRFHWKNWATETSLKVSFISWVLPVMERIMKSTPYFSAIFTLVSSICPSSRSSKASLFCHHSTGGSELEKFQMLLKPTCSSKATLQIEEPALVSRCCRDFTCPSTESKFTVSVSHAPPSSHADWVSITWIMTSAPNSVIAMVFWNWFSNFEQRKVWTQKRQGTVWKSLCQERHLSSYNLRLPIGYRVSIWGISETIILIGNMMIIAILAFPNFESIPMYIYNNVQQRKKWSMQKPIESVGVKINNYACQCVYLKRQREIPSNGKNQRPQTLASVPWGSTTSARRIGWCVKWSQTKGIAKDDMVFCK